MGAALYGGLLVMYLLASPLLASMARAQQIVSATPDVTIALGGSPIVAADEDVGIDSGVGFFLQAALCVGYLPSDTLNFDLVVMAFGYLPGLS